MVSVGFKEASFASEAFERNRQLRQGAKTLTTSYMDPVIGNRPVRSSDSDR